jgi:prophage maintenance system killer protein
MAEIVIYTTYDGQVELDVNLAEETVWLSLNQMAKLFGRDKSVISRHLLNIFKSGELDKPSTVAIFATLQQEGGKDVKRDIEYFNLDAIISVGYRVNSKEGVQFRKWATHVLKEHLIRGYTTHKKRLAERGINELQQTVELLQKTLTHHELVSDLGAQAIQLILSYAKTWRLLLAYDENRLSLPTQERLSASGLSYKVVIDAITALKTDLMAKGQATSFFGNERENSLDSILHNIEQTFGGEPLYRSIEEKAAHLFYFIIKDHPFTDGNKRIGCFIFLLYLKLQQLALKLNENGLVALALLVAESNPSQKDLMIGLIVNLLIDPVS